MIIRLAIPLKLSQLCKFGCADFKRASDIEIERIVTDSREIEKNDLFAAFVGEHFDGNDFLYDAKSSGAVCLSTFGKGADIECESVEHFLLRLANKYITLLENIKFRVAITGSVGKTSTKEFISSMLSNKYTVHKSYGNYNNTLGLAITVLTCPKNAEIIVAELGMNHAGEISVLSKNLMPTHAVITNIGHAHIGFLGSRENIASAKLEILDGLIGNYLIAPYEEDMLSGKNFIYYSLLTTKANRFLSQNGDILDYYENGCKKLSAKTALTAEHHLKSLLIAISLSRELGLSDLEIEKGTENIHADILRQKHYISSDFEIIDDTYSSSPEAVIAELSWLKKCKGTFSVLLGDMLELGDMTRDEHRRIGRFVFESGARNLFTFGKLSRDIALSAMECGMPRDRIFINEDISNPTLSADAIKENTIKGETVLIKASHSIHSERIVDLLKGQEKC